jgi:hypothetical protein
MARWSLARLDTLRRPLHSFWPEFWPEPDALCLCATHLLALCPLLHCESVSREHAGVIFDGFSSGRKVAGPVVEPFLQGCVVLSDCSFDDSTVPAGMVNINDGFVLVERTSFGYMHGEHAIPAISVDASAADVPDRIFCDRDLTVRVAGGSLQNRSCSTDGSPSCFLAGDDPELEALMMV